MSEKLTKMESLFGEALAKQLLIGQAQAGQLEMIYKQLKSIRTAVSPKLSDRSYYVSIPDGGGVYTLAPGATTIDFYEGDITPPTGRKVKLRAGLKGKGLDEMRSVVMVTSGPITISLDGAGKFNLEAGEKLALGEFGFKNIYIESAVAGSIRLIAATTPSFTVFYDKYFSAELLAATGPVDDTLYDVTMASAQTVSLDLGDMRRMLVEAYGQADAATTFTLETSDDTMHWFVVETEAGVTHYSFGGANTKRYIRLTSASAGAPGDEVSLTLSAVR